MEGEGLEEAKNSIYEKVWIYLDLLLLFRFGKGGRGDSIRRFVSFVFTQSRADPLLS